jgi:hypothetical protein
MMRADELKNETFLSRMLPAALKACSESITEKGTKLAAILERPTRKNLLNES